MNVSRTPEGVSTAQIFQKEAAAEATEISQEDKAMKNAALMGGDAKNVTATAKWQKAAKTRKANNKKVNKAMLGAHRAGSLAPLQKLKDSAANYHQNNEELKESDLLDVREYITGDDTPEDILGKLDQYWKNDGVLQEDALNFLIENAPEGSSKENLEKAKELLVDKFGRREQTAGRNIATVSREVEYGGVAVAKSLRDYYLTFTKEDHDANSLFRELSVGRTFEELNKVSGFLFHALGADLNSKGPSIDPGQLHKLMTEVKTLQAVLGVYRFFQNREPLVEKMFAEEQLNVPPQLNFEKMSQGFMEFVSDRYPSADKALQITARMGISDEGAAAA